VLLPDGRQQWREDAIEELLAIQDADVLFVAGCEGNRVRFRPQFDVIILLGAPAGVLIERLASRHGDLYGKATGELARVVETCGTSSRCRARPLVMRSGPCRWPMRPRRCRAWRPPEQAARTSQGNRPRPVQYHPQPPGHRTADI
jgi:hypothetical protein